MALTLGRDRDRDQWMTEEGGQADRRDRHPPIPTMAGETDVLILPMAEDIVMIAA